MSSGAEPLRSASLARPKSTVEYPLQDPGPLPCEVGRTAKFLRSVYGRSRPSSASLIVKHRGDGRVGARDPMIRPVFKFFEPGSNGTSHLVMQQPPGSRFVKMCVVIASSYYLGGEGCALSAAAVRLRLRRLCREHRRRPKKTLRERRRPAPPGAWFDIPAAGILRTPRTPPSMPTRPALRPSRLRARGSPARPRLPRRKCSP
jgi:hypothetical protein